MQTSSATKKIVFTGVFSALSLILYFFEFPIIPGSNYLQVDLSDLPAAVAAVLFGPGSGFAVELIKNVFHLIIKGLGSTMGYGDLMNFIVGIALVVPISAVMRSMMKHDANRIGTILLSGFAGMFVMVAAGAVGNYLIAPPYFEAFMHYRLTGAVLWTAIGSATVLNLIKSVMVTVLLIPLLTWARKIMPHTLIGKN